MNAADLDPIEERLRPLAQAIGRAVLGAAALERILLLDLAQRRAAAEGLTKRLERELSTVEVQPAGALLKTLRQLDIPLDLAGRIQEVIGRRNQLVHRFMEDLDVAVAFSTGEGVDPIVERVDGLAADCQSLINEIAPEAFSGAGAALGQTLPELLEQVNAADLDVIEDDRLRAQLEWIRHLDLAELKSLRKSRP
ncbi:MAG TPA: hypothetical protein VF545_07305 [Thermoleophilaceae bacterium]|jgi:hypothetical protein